MSKAGGRARREYERRRLLDAQRLRARLPYIVGFLVLIGPIVYGLSRVVLTKFFASLSPHTALSARDVHQVSLWLAIATFLTLAGDAFRRRSSTHAFRIGAEGEERVGAVLDSLAKHGYRMVHDAPLRGYGNIDHIVVGPGGVFTIETKNAGGKVRIRNRVIRENGRRRDEYIAQACRQVELVRSKLSSEPGSIPVTPLLCYARAEIDVSFFGTNVIDGVRVVSLRRLKRVIVKARPLTGPEQVARVHAKLEESTAPIPSMKVSPYRPPAPIPRCTTCGSKMVLRRRRTDGVPFYGCERYPICRGTRPAT